METEAKRGGKEEASALGLEEQERQQVGSKGRGQEKRDDLGMISQKHEKGFSL